MWDNCGAVNSDRLEKVQTEAARIVTGLTSYASLDSIYCETGWEKLIVRREVRKPNLFYKIINNEAPVVRREVRKPNLFYKIINNGIFIRVDTSNSFRIK